MNKKHTEDFFRILNENTLLNILSEEEDEDDVEINDNDIEDTLSDESENVEEIGDEEIGDEEEIDMEDEAPIEDELPEPDEDELVDDTLEVDDEVSAEDDEYVDVTEFVETQEEVKQDVEVGNKKLGELIQGFNSLYKKYEELKSIEHKISDLNLKIDDRIPSKEQKIEMRKDQYSYPYNTSMNDAWGDEYTGEGDRINPSEEELEDKRINVTEKPSGEKEYSIKVSDILDGLDLIPDNFETMNSFNRSTYGR